MGDKTDVWQGTLALMVLKTLETMGPLHGYGIARRIEQTSGDLLPLNYGTLYPALLKLEQEGAIASEWGTSDNNRKAKYYKLTRAGRKQLEQKRATGSRRPRSSRAFSPPPRRDDAHAASAVDPPCGLFGARRASDEIAAELESHLQMHIDDNLRAGMTPEEARRQALIQLGGMEQTQPGLCASATLCPGLSTSAGSPLRTAPAAQSAWIYHGCHHHLGARHRRQHGAVFHRQHGAPPPHRVAAPRRTGRGRCRQAQFRDWFYLVSQFPRLAEGQSQLHRACDFRHLGFLLTGAGQTERIHGDLVSSDLFSMLGVKPVIGRLFAPGEDEIGRAPLVLIGQGFWARKLGSDPDVIGRAIDLDGRAYTIIGVIPSAFDLNVGSFKAQDVYIPIGQWNTGTLKLAAQGSAFTASRGSSLA